MKKLLWKVSVYMQGRFIVRACGLSEAEARLMQREIESADLIARISPHIRIRQKMKFNNYY